MAIQKPSKPDVTLPDNFGGVKTPYTESQISNGYQEAVPQVVDGGNINYEKDAVFKYLKYLKTATDALVDMPIGKILTVDSNNRFEYANPTVIANDSEYEEGALTTKSPSVKQVRDSFADLDNKITNCITEIPQDIKLELNDGTLTLKAGSKVYVPNGAGVFDGFTVSADRTVTNTTNGTYLTCLSTSGNALTIRLLDSCTSGAGATAIGGFAYDTTGNMINNYSGTGVKGGQYSLPIAIVTVSNGAISSIDQVFNGFGYIGNTLFALPGVKGLIPNGFNTDGSLNSIEAVSTKVNTYTRTNGLNSGDIRILFQPNGGVFYGGQVTYDNKNNFLLNYGAANQALDAGSVTIDSTGRITSFTPRTAFHALDYNEVVHKTGDEADNSTKIATTEWVNSRISSNAANKDLSNITTAGQTVIDNRITTLMNTNYSARVTISASPYTAPSNGVVYLTQSKGNHETTVTVDGVTVLKMNGHGGSSHGQPRPCATVIVGKGSVITFNNIVNSYFVPFG